jgi:sigma-B regulation protein RsbU (phosphoserine phosphatase)
VTFFYLVLNPEDGAVTYANAGHNRPLWRRQSGEVASLDVSGVPLGVFAQSDYEAYRIDLQPGESLVLYSDGITECQNSNSDFFGEARLEAVVAESAELSPQQTMDGVFSAVDAFRQGQAHSDDMTLVVLKRLGL